MTTLSALSEDTTLKEAKQYLNSHLDKGCVCPACEQICKRYARKLTSSMAYGLYLVHRITKLRETDWIHLEDEFKNLNVPSSIRGDLPKLRFWGLLERKEHTTDDGNPNNGFYRITKAGEDFIQMKSRVREKIILYNNHLYGYDGDYFDFKQAINNKFNYEQLMKGL